MTDFGGNWGIPPGAGGQPPMLPQPTSVFYVSEVELEAFVPESEEELYLWWTAQRSALEGGANGLQAAGAAAASVIRRRRMIQRMDQRRGPNADRKQ